MDKIPIPGIETHFLVEESPGNFQVWSERLQRFMIVGEDKDGYKKLHINRKFWRIHRLVAFVFHGPCPEGLECCHKDDNKLNNSPDNLHYRTHDQNIEDKVKNKKTSKGEKHSAAIIAGLRKHGK